jgi:single stranded DNA-binding protein
MYLNCIQLIGTTPWGINVRGQADNQFVTFTLVTTKSYKDKTGAWQSKNDKHSISVFNKKYIDYAIQNIKENSIVFIEGELSYGSYQKNGVATPVTNITISAFEGLVAVLKDTKTYTKTKEQGTSNINLEAAPVEEPIFTDEIPF